VLAPPELGAAVGELEAAVPAEAVPVAAELLVAALEPLLDAAVAPVAPVVPVLPVVAALSEEPEVGTVRDGIGVLSADAAPPPPQAARPTTRSRPATSSARVRDEEGTLVDLPLGQEPRGSIRLPQYGQSFKSFWLS
jgi:hypothetical protein